MPIQANQSDTWDFTVKQEPILHNGKETGFWGNFRTDTGTCLGMTSERYGLIQNRQLVDAAISALAVRGMKDYETRILTAGDGQRLYAVFEFRNRTAETKVGDVFGYSLTLKNSFDRTKRALIALGFIRLVCSNGMSVNEHEFAVTQKHSSAISIDFIGKAIDHAVERAPQALEVYDQLAQVKTTTPQGINMLAHFEDSGLLSGKVREGVQHVWEHPKYSADHPRNLYTLYNAVTQHLTHQVSASRFEYANKTSRLVLVSLIGAMNDKKRFRELIVPVPQSEKTVITAGGPVIDVQNLA